MFWEIQNGMFFVNSQTKFAHLSDGASSTILVGESLVAETAVQPDGSGGRQIVDHWAIGSPTFAANEVSEALGSTAVPIGNSLKRDPAIYPDEQELSFSSRHSGGCQFVFCDGHVSLLSHSIDKTIYSSLGTRDEQEMVGAATSW
jgi:prepilin-type processing-associated H-X9-DG protein